MSIAALSWAFETEIKPSTCKLVMLALADCADGDGNGLCFPSIEALVDKTNLDRKTVFEAIGKLEEMGLLIDTGNRIGSTMRVKVYRINGLPTFRHHYIYVLRHADERYYVGVRSCWGSPSEDMDYMGSGRWPVQMRQSKEPLTKTILQEFDTRAEAEVAERELLQESLDDPLCMNKQSRKRNHSVFPPNSTESGTIKEENGTISGNPRGCLPRGNSTGSGMIPDPDRNSTGSGTRIRQDPKDLKPIVNSGEMKDIKTKDKRFKDNSRARGKPSKICPADWQLTDALILWAAKKYPSVNLEYQAEKFRDHEFPRAYSDFDACFRNWVRKAHEIGDTRAPTPDQPRKTPGFHDPNEPRKYKKYEPRPWDTADAATIAQTQTEAMELLRHVQDAIGTMPDVSPLSDAEINTRRAELRRQATQLEDTP